MVPPSVEDFAMTPKLIGRLLSVRGLTDAMTGDADVDLRGRGSADGR